MSKRQRGGNVERAEAEVTGQAAEWSKKWVEGQLTEYWDALRTRTHNKGLGQSRNLNEEDGDLRERERQR